MHKYARIKQINSLTGFFPLGDIVNNNYNYPTKKVMMVLDKKDGLVAPPASFRLTCIVNIGQYFIFHFSKTFCFYHK